MKVKELRELLYMFPANASVTIRVDGYDLILTPDNFYHEDHWLYITPEYNE